MKKLHLFLVTLITFSLSTFFVACEKDEGINLTTISVSNEQFTPSYTSATLKCGFNTKATLRNVYVQYATKQDFAEYKEREMSRADDVYIVVLDGLQENTTYYIRYAVSNRYSSAMIEEISTFQTLQPSVPTITLKSISDIWDTHAKVQIASEFDGGTPIEEMGICWDTQASPVVESHKLTTRESIAVLEINDLQPNTQYFARAYAKNKMGIAYSEEYEFTTYALPEIRTEDITDIQSTAAFLKGTLVFDGNDTATIKGFCWSTNDEPTLENNHIEIDTTSATYTCRLSNLIDETQYYVRAYAKNKIGVVYGESKSFTTQSAVSPTVSTNEVTEVEYHSATIAAAVISDGGADVTERGICYSTTENPTTESNKVVSGKGTGSYTIKLSDLKDSTTYYVRAYAINKKGIAYGAEKSFTTSAVALPIVTTSSATNIGYTTATIGGNVTADGGASVTERGVVYSTSSNPTTSNSKVTSGSGMGSFSCNITNLQEGTTYYVRAYAINEKGTAYGAQKSFTTKAYALPTVTTSSVTNISKTSATVGGNVTSDGGASVTERGVVYSTSSNPTTSNSKVTSGSGTGSFTCSLTNLQDGTTYYVRAYAINEKGTAYGEQKSFTTKAYALPTVTTSDAINITYTSATIGGNVTSDGGASVTERGVVYSTVSNPVINNIYHTTKVVGSGTGPFSVNLTNLVEGTTYYVRAYATNEKGTAYGNQVVFTTFEAPIENGHEYVDLGLSVKWATCNLGGTKPEDYGNQFSWGEATPSWGGRWRLPTAGEVDELINSCTFTWTTLNSVKGYMVVSKSNGNSIFLPAAGYNGSSFRDSYGMYWTSSLNTYDSSKAYCLYFWNITVKKEFLACTYRHSVRLVCP